MKITLAIISRKSVHSQNWFQGLLLKCSYQCFNKWQPELHQNKAGKKTKHNYRVLSKFTVKDLLPFIILTSNHKIGISVSYSDNLKRLVFVITQPPTPEAHCQTPSCHGNVLKVAMAAIVSFSFYTKIHKRSVHSLKPNLTLVIGCFYIHMYIRSIAHSAHVFWCLRDVCTV